MLAPDDRPQVEQVLRYVTRPPWRTDGVRLDAKGRVCVETPPDPKGAQTECVLDPIEWVHAVVQQIPDPGLHLVRYYGAYANKIRGRWAALRAKTGVESGKGDAAMGGEGGAGCGSTAASEGDPPESEFVRKRKANWARLLRRLFEVDPMIGVCGGELKVLAVITQPEVIDRILGHLAQHGGKDAHPGPDSPAACGVVPADVTD